MDEELVRGSTPPAAAPAGDVSHDWNTSLAGPATDPGSTAADGSSMSGTTDTQPGTAQPESTRGTTRPESTRPESTLPGRAQPEWRDPAALPGVQRARTGTFGQTLAALDQATRDFRAALAAIDVDHLSDPEIVALTQTVERAGRPVDAARVTTATVIGYRSRRGRGRDSLAWRLGASCDTDLLSRLTGTSAAEMKRRVALGEKVAPRMSGGQVLDPVFPLVAAALQAGEIGVEAAANIVKGLTDYTVHGRFDANPADVDAAEAGLVEAATGSIYGRVGAGTDGDGDDDADGPVQRLGDSQGFTYPADRIQEMTKLWQARLNPDGAAPNEAVLEAKSSFSFGRLRDDGLYPIRGGVTPELKGQISKVFDSYLSARSAPAFPSAEEQRRLEAGELVPGEALDERTGGEKRADILRGIFTEVSQDPRTPTLGGLPPTVMVHVNATDLLAGTGVGWIDGVDGPVSMKTVTQLIDNGGMQPIFFGATGAVLGLGSKARCFSPLQRKAITARDGGCIIPGCSTPPHWTEIHHVIPWQHGGATTVENGVLLCWYHHHTIDSSGWGIRMVGGMPQVKAPAWIDATGTWRKPHQHRAHDPRTRRDAGPPE